MKFSTRYNSENCISGNLCGGAGGLWEYFTQSRILIENMDWQKTTMDLHEDNPRVSHQHWGLYSSRSETWLQRGKIWQKRSKFWSKNLQIFFPQTLQWNRIVLFFQSVDKFIKNHFLNVKNKAKLKAKKREKKKSDLWMGTLFFKDKKKEKKSHRQYYLFAVMKSWLAWK